MAPRTLLALAAGCAAMMAATTAAPLPGMEAASGGGDLAMIARLASAAGRAARSVSSQARIPAGLARSAKRFQSRGRRELVANDDELAGFGPANQTAACAASKEWMEGLDRYCPKQCLKADDRTPEASLPVCSDGQRERDGGSCGTDACGTFLADTTDEWIEQLSVGYAECAASGHPGDEIVGGLLGGPAGPSLIGMLLHSLAADCGKSESLNLAVQPPHPAASCRNSVDFMAALDVACPKHCTNDEGERTRTGLPPCADGESDRTAQSCGQDSCASFMAAVSDDKVAELESGFQQCIFDGEGFEFIYAAIFGAPGTTAFVLQLTAMSCGPSITLGTSKSGCMQSMGFFSQVDEVCPKRCSDEDDEGERNGLPKCTGGQNERSHDSCHTDACGEFLGTIDDAKINTIMSGFQSCTGPYAVYTEHFAGDGGSDTITMAVLGTASECGHLDRLELDSGRCYSSIEQLKQIETKCPRTCRQPDDDDDTSNLPICESGQPDRSPSSCGTLDCQDFIAGFSSTATRCGFESCRGSLFEQHMLAVLEGLEGDPSRVVMEVALACGLFEQLDHAEWSPASRECGAAQMFGGELESACPKECCAASECSDEDRYSGVAVCSDGANERTASSCGIDSCRAFLSKVTAGTLNSVACGYGACGHPMDARTGYDLLVGVAAQCELADAFAITEDEFNATAVSECPPLATTVPVVCGSDSGDSAFDDPGADESTSTSTSTSTAADSSGAATGMSQPVVALLTAATAVVAAAFA